MLQRQLSLQTMNSQDVQGPVEFELDWSDLLQRHAGWLRQVVAARSGEPQAVDEIMQEVSIAAVKQQAPLRDPERIAPWLYQIAVRQSLMYRRKHGRRRSMEQRYAQQVESRPSDERPMTPLDWMLADERRGMVREAMRRLKPKEAEILLLKYTEDWSYRDIANHLGISESAVESRLTRARKNLRRELTASELSETRL